MNLFRNIDVVQEEKVDKIALFAVLG